MALKVSRILHAGYLFDDGISQIAFDTIFENPFSRNCHAFPSIQFDQEAIRKLNLTAVFISHFHDDHFSLTSLNLLNRNTPIYMFCVFDELIDLIRDLGFKKVYSLQLNEPVVIGGFEIIPRRALDADVDCLYQVKAAGFNILNVVDSWIDYETLDLLVREKPWDMILWPFQTMRELEVIAPDRAGEAPSQLPPEWLEQLQKLQPRIVVPSSCQFTMESWSWYNHAFFPVTYRQFEQEVSAVLPEAQILRMNPGCSFEFDKTVVKPGASLRWIHPVGDQNVDYVYQPSHVPPSTAEIARHLEALTIAQEQQVLEYCRNGILEKYRTLEESPDPYFEEKRLWVLSIYNHMGQRTDFWYQLEKNQMDLVEASSNPDWCTEIPMTKLYGALELGESLTSIYLRINGSKFEELIDDPLLRCLYNGVLGGYQKAQMKALKVSK